MTARQRHIHSSGGPSDDRSRASGLRNVDGGGGASAMSGGRAGCGTSTAAAAPLPQADGPARAGWLRDDDSCSPGGRSKGRPSEHQDVHGRGRTSAGGRRAGGQRPGTAVAGPGFANPAGPGFAQPSAPGGLIRPDAAVTALCRVRITCTVALMSQ